MEAGLVNERLFSLCSANKSQTDHVLHPKENAISCIASGVHGG